MNSRKLPARWAKERKMVRAVQVAFDLGARVQKQIRQEALDLDMNPSDRVRQILGLSITHRPQRLRLSISIAPADFEELARAFDLDPDDHVGIKKRAAELLVQHVGEGRE